MINPDLRGSDTGEDNGRSTSHSPKEWGVDWAEFGGGGHLDRGSMGVSDALSGIDRYRRSGGLNVCAGTKGCPSSDRIRVLASLQRSHSTSRWLSEMTHLVVGSS